jgi:hypothetical protein
MSDFIPEKFCAQLCHGYAEAKRQGIEDAFRSLIGAPSTYARARKTRSQTVGVKLVNFMVAGLEGEAREKVNTALRPYHHSISAGIEMFIRHLASNPDDRTATVEQIEQWITERGGLRQLTIEYATIYRAARESQKPKG